MAGVRRRAYVLFTFLIFCQFLGLEAGAVPRTPWPARKRRTEDGLRPGLHQLKRLDRWPAEPASPQGTIDTGKFEAGMGALCAGVITARQARKVGEGILAAAVVAGVDPFLLGALVYRQSRCNPLLESSFGVGLLQIQGRMLQASLRGNQLNYKVLENGNWVDRKRTVPTGALARLKEVDVNLRLGAALLAMWQEQHPAIDKVFPGNVPHRGAAAHFGWGDVVRGSGGEDRALIARRRLVNRYLGVAGKVQPTTLGFSVVSPLEGEPRVATSGLGEDREDGVRAHRGVDLDATSGEPIASIADGVVWFTGYDLPGREKPLVVLPEDLGKPRPSLGPGGLFICIRHVPSIFSCYMHLSSYTVRVNDPVKAGQVVAAVGRSGTHVSGAHLHLEIHQDGKAIDPSPILGEALVIPPTETLAHDQALANQAHRLKLERRARRKARFAERVARATGILPAPNR